MFCVSEAEAAAIRSAYEQKGEFAAAIELRRLFPGITDNAKARSWARVAVMGQGHSRVEAGACSVTAGWRRLLAKHLTGRL